MGIVIDSKIWEPKPSLCIFLFFSSFLSIFLLPYFSNNPNRSSPSPDLSSTVSSLTKSSFLRFQRIFLLLYSLASVIQGLQSVFGEFEYAYYGATKDQMVVTLCIGSVAAILIGTFLGMISDIIGQKKICVLFGILHIFVGIWKKFTMHPSAWIVSICTALASSVFSFSFETWTVTEHDKLGHRQDLLSEIFWLMTFFESVSLIGSQMIGNFLVGMNPKNGTGLPSVAIALLAFVCIIYITREWKKSSRTAGFGD